MGKLERYIDSLYKDVEGSTEELNLLKQEMREHLELTINEFRKAGKTEEESIRLALDRFGNKQQIGGELKSVFNKKGSLATGLLIAALVFFTAAIVFIISTRIGNNFLSQNYNNSGQAENDYLISRIEKSINNNKGISKEDLNKIIEGRNEGLAGIDTKLILVAATKVPQTLSYDEYVSTVSYSDFDYVFNGPISKRSPNYKVFTRRIHWGKDTWHVEVRMAEPLDITTFNTLNFTIIMSTLADLMLLAYWIIFAVWASLKAKSLGRLHIIWVLMFLALNIAAYIVFIITGRINNIKIINRKF